MILSADSNNFNSNTYPKDVDVSASGCRVLMGHAAMAMGPLRGNQVAFHVPAYRQFPVSGAGPTAQIDMSESVYAVSANGDPAQAMQGPAELTPAEARQLGILPGTMPDPRGE